MVHASSVVKKVTGLATALIQAQVVVEEAVGVVGAEAMRVGVLQGMEAAMVVLQVMVVTKAEVGVGAEVGEQRGCCHWSLLQMRGTRPLEYLLSQLIKTAASTTGLDIKSSCQISDMT